MKKLVIILIMFQYACAAQDSTSKEKNIITVYNDYDLYSYEYIGDVSCTIAANDKTVQENIAACQSILDDEARRLNADAIHIVKEENCLNDSSIDCASSNAVKMSARAHRND